MSSNSSKMSDSGDTAADNDQPFKKKRRGGWDVQTPVIPILNNNSLNASLTNVLTTLMQQKQQKSIAIPTAPLGNPSLGGQSAPTVKNNDHRIYIGSINYEVTEIQIRKLFEPFGTIVKVDMSVDPTNGKTKGFCFIEYQNFASVQAAMVMDGFELANRKIKVGRPANASTPVQTPTIDPNTSSVMPPTQLQPLSTHNATLAATSLLINPAATTTVVSTNDSALTAASSEQAPAVIGIAKKIVIRNIHSAFSDGEIKTIFVPFGSITSCCASSKNGGESTKEISIEFKSASCAQQALALNGFFLGGVPLVIAMST